MKEDIRVHMPYEVFKNLLVRAGRIKREEGKQITWTNNTAPFTKEQRREIDELYERFVEEGGRMKETIKEFLKFRSQFTKLEWHEINQAVEACLNQKADQLKLDNIDLEIISIRLEGKIQ